MEELKELPFPEDHIRNDYRKYAMPSKWPIFNKHLKTKLASLHDTPKSSFLVNVVVGLFTTIAPQIGWVYVKIFVICNGTVHILWRLWMMSGMLGKYYFSTLSNVIFHQNNLNLSATHRG